jgi:hypothetical protein
MGQVRTRFYTTIPETNYFMQAVCFLERDFPLDGVALRPVWPAKMVQCATTTLRRSWVLLGVQFISV